ncbi:hypothetical protein M8J76_007458 [Diaphorina citri]|nr:hypothetical protein M8J76_007458 [Diaphorina citri]
MKSSVLWKQKVVDEIGVKQCVYDTCFDPEGKHILATGGNHVLVYNAKDGSLIHTLKAHKDLVYSVSYSPNGKTFASGSADKNVFIWSHDFERIQKYR